MSHVTGRAWFSLAILGALLTGLWAIAILTPTAARAEQFCWGTEIKGNETCGTTYRYISSGRAKGNLHSVCLNLPSVGVRCSSGPEAWVELSGPNALGYGVISGNQGFESPPTHVFGEVF